MPAAARLTLAGLGVAVAASLIAASVVPGMLDVDSQLSRIARRAADGPKSPEDATAIKSEFHEAVQQFLRKHGDLASSALQEKLSELLPSNAFEVHVAELPRGLRIVEIDTLLQASDYLLMKGTSGMKVFPLPGLEVFGDARIINDTAGTVLIVTGHSGGQPPYRPQVKAYALLPDQINEETEKVVPVIHGEGKARFAANDQDIELELDVASLLQDAGFYPAKPGTDRLTLNQRLVWNEGRYSVQPERNSHSLATLWALADSMTRPDNRNRYQEYLGTEGSAFARDNAAKAPFAYTKTIQGNTVKYTLVGDGKQITFNLKKSDGIWRFANAQSQTLPEATVAGIVNAAMAANRSGSPEAAASVAPAPAQPALADGSVAAAGQSNKDAARSTQSEVLSQRPSTSGAAEIRVATSAFINPDSSLRPLPASAENRSKSAADSVLRPEIDQQKPTAGTAAADASPSSIPSGGTGRTTERATNQAAPAAAPAPTSNSGSASSAPIGQGYISDRVASTVRLRSSASSSSSIVGSVPRGESVHVLGKENGWYKVKYRGAEGFVYAGLVDLSKPTAYTTAVVTKKRNVLDRRQKPLATAQPGDRVVLLSGLQNNRYKVQLANGKTGFVDKDAVDLSIETPEFVP